MTTRLCLLMMLALTMPAFAYLDPATGNIAVMAVMWLVGGIAVAYHRIRLSVASAFNKSGKSSKKKSKKKAKATASTDSEQGDNLQDESAEQEPESGKEDTATKS